MKKIYKYTLDRSVRCVLDMPMDSRVLCVQMQGGEICLWAEVDPAFAKFERVYCVIGTGRECPVGNYIGTVQENGFVWHIYEIK